MVLRDNLLADRPRGRRGRREIVVNSVHVGAGADASRRGASLKALRAHRLPDRRPAHRPGPGHPCACASDRRRGGLRPRPPGADGRRRQRPVRRRRHPPDAGRRPEDGQVDVLISRSTGPWRGSSTPSASASPATTSARTSPARRPGLPVSGGPFWCSADGEVYGPERQRTWHVEPAAYHMLPFTPEGRGSRRTREVIRIVVTVCRDDVLAPLASTRPRGSAVAWMNRWIDPYPQRGDREPGTPASAPAAPPRRRPVGRNPRRPAGRRRRRPMKGPHPAAPYRLDAGLEPAVGPENRSSGPPPGGAPCAG